MTAASTDLTPAQKQLALHGGTPVRTKPYPPRRLFGEAEKAAAMALLDGCIERGEAYGYGGEHEDAYCKAFAELHGGGFADCVNSGTSALYVALRSLELEPFTEVIVPPITDPGGLMPVAMMNCIPIVADSAPGSYNVSAEQIEAVMTDRTSAIVVTHISGEPVDMDPILALAKKHGVYVVEDCAQTHLATYKGRVAGTMGDVAAFSTMFGKHHATGGQGGVVFTKDESRYHKVRRCADRGKPFFLEGTHGNVTCSLNLNQDEMGCAIGRVQLEKLPGIVKARQAFVHRIAKGIADLKAVSIRTGLPDTEPAFWFGLVRLDFSKLSCDKATFVEAFNAEGVRAGAGYRHIICEHDWFTKQSVFGTSGYPWAAPEYKGDRHPTFALPNAKAADDEHIMLTVNESLGDEVADDVAKALVKVEQAYLKG